MKKLVLFSLAAVVALAQPSPQEQIIEAAYRGDLARVAKAYPRGGVAVWGQDFLFVAASPMPVTLSLNQQVPLPMTRIPGTNLWMRLDKMRTGVTYAYQFFADGKPLGNRGDLVGYNPDSYPKVGVPRGKLSEKQTITSRVFDGMKADYWFYASPGVDPQTPAAFMIWQDGQGQANPNAPMRVMTVTENLIQQKLVPPLVHVFIAPGHSPDGKAMRSIEYDTVSDRYARFVLEEVVPEVEKVYKLRTDAYSRAIAGGSSGGICAFNAAWFLPDKFARVLSWVGSFTSIQWHPEQKLDGGNIYPFKVRKEPKRNIRVWMSDGSDDLENDHGSWPLQNIQLANSLKMKDYDFHFRFGTAAHGGAQASLDMPEALTWLWRGYDPSKTSQEFTIDPVEKQKPLYRVSIANRDAW
jgi:enterochelin esterase family protein